MASTIKSNIVTNATASTLTLGESGTTVTLACGATQSGFGRTGTVDWCTTVKTSPLTAVSGNGYFINTTGGAITVTLPSSPSAGDIVSLKDYLDTWAVACKAVTLGRGGSKIGGNCLDATLNTKGQSVTMIYVDGTRGWENIQTDTTITGQEFVAATGGNITTVCSDYKVHTFLADGCFQVTDAGGPSGSNTVDYMIVAGGAGGGYNGSGGGGAGGWRASAGTGSGCFTAGPSPLTSPVSPMPVSVATYPIVVGGGGAGGTAPSPGPATKGVSGDVSSFNSISSAGGGGGGGPAPDTGVAGGSGGGTGRSPGSAGAGNTPPVSPPQGNAGGTQTGPGAGAGGGAIAVGGNGAGPSGPGVIGGIGGAGSDSSISGSPVAYAGGGGGASDSYAGSGGPGGAGGGGTGGGLGPPVSLGGDGTTNTGGGGGGGGNAQNAGAGGSGVVIIRYKFQ